MAVLKCKMCGGNLQITEGMTVCECEYCGTSQTVPAVDDEKMLNLFERANRLRRNCEFDKAAGVYENIVAEYPQEAEGYWGLILCRYGIEYVDDPSTGKKVPTCHRSSFDSIMDDEDFDMVMENSDSVSRKQYRDEAKRIEELRKGIIEVSGKEEPYDIFICYKETDDDGNRTIDSVLAQDVYDELTNKGYRVFFSRISLESKLGVEYEPYIFAALNSSKIMLVFGTTYDYFNAVWVKNEWSRYLSLMAKDKTKHLIPCFKNVDAYDIPKEFGRFQSQDMGKIGAVQDLIRGIDKLIGGEKEDSTAVNLENAAFGGASANGSALLKRGFMSIEDGQWDKATEFFEQVLNINAEEGRAYWGELLAQSKCKTTGDLAQTLSVELVNRISVEELIIDKPAWCKTAKNDYICLALFDVDELFKDFKYLSKVSSVNSIIEVNKADFVLSKNRLFQRASQYSNAAVSSDIQALKDKIDLLLHKKLNDVKDEEKSVYEAALSESVSYYKRLKEALDYANELAKKNAEKNEAVFRDEHAVWEAERDRFPALQEQWNLEMEKYHLEVNAWKEHLRRWDAEERAYNEQKAPLEAWIAQLEDQLHRIDGPFSEMKTAAKKKEIMAVRVKLSRLKAPENPMAIEPPQEPVAPVLRQEPVLTIEERLDKDSVIEAFYSRFNQQEQFESVEMGD